MGKKFDVGKKRMKLLSVIFYQTLLYIMKNLVEVPAGVCFKMDSISFGSIWASSNPHIRKMIDW